MLVYLGAKVVSAFSNALQTAPALHVTENDSFFADGWFFRDEITVSGSASETVRHLVHSGERVQQDAPLAIIYANDQSLEVSRSISSLDQKITMLDNALQSVGDESDAAKLDQSIVTSLQQLAGQLKNGAGTALDATAESIRTQSLRRSASSLDSATITSERDSLSTQRDELDGQLSGSNTEISAPSSGYFSEIVDGYEEILTLDALEDLYPEQLKALTQQKKVVNTPATLGKIIQGFSWYLAAEVPVADAERLKEGQNIYVGLTQASIETPVSVLQINKRQNAETAVIVLEGADFSTEIVSMRNQPIEVIIGTYTGLKVPKEAIHMSESGKTGVYILNGNISKFKTIDKLYESDKFYIVEQKATDADALVEQDLIIIRGKGLQDNTVVKT